MRMIAGAIVVLAGSITLAAGLFAPAHAERSGPPLGEVVMLAGAAVGAIGIIIVLVEWRAGCHREDGTDRHPPSAH